MYYFPCHALLSIYRSFVRPDLEYGDVIYDQASKIERVEYNASLAITGGIRKIYQEKLYQELGLESFRTRKKIFKAHITILQTNCNSKAITSFQPIPAALENRTYQALIFVIQPLTNNFNRRISVLILSKFKQINEFLFPSEIFRIF